MTLLPYAWASDGTFGRAYELDALELGRRVAVALLWEFDIAPSLVEALVCWGCGCTEFDSCVGPGGEVCGWAEPGLCTFCARDPEVREVAPLDRFL